MALTQEQIATLSDTVRDPRYTQEKFMKGLVPSAVLKEAIVANRMVEKLNKAYGWDFPENMEYKDLMKNSRQMNNIIFDIVTKPGYTLEKFLMAIQSGKQL